MTLRLMIIQLFVMLLLSACATPPVKELAGARQSLAYAKASGAAEFAPEVYRTAEQALLEADQFIDAGNYAEAVDRLQQTDIFSKRALNLTVYRKKALEQENNRKQVERKAQEEAAKKAQLLKEQQAALQKKKAQQKKKAVPAAKPKPHPEPVLVDQVKVEAGDTLASISARKNVYGDKLLWPLIYKANRDQIKDPRVISSGQTLHIPRDKGSDEINAARQEALELNLF